MNTSKLILAAIVGAIANFLLGWLIYGIILRDTMSKGMTPEANALNKTEMNYLGVFIACLLYSCLLSYIFERWSKSRTIVSGMVAGAIIGFLMTASFDTQLWSMTNMYSSMSFVMIDILAATIMASLTGAVVAWTLGFKRTD